MANSAPARKKPSRNIRGNNGLDVDGIAGPATLEKMGLFGISQASIAASVVGAGENVWDTITEATEGALSKVKSFFGY